MVVLFGCQQCRPPGAADLAMLGLGLWAFMTFTIVLVAAWARQRRR